MQDRSSFPEGSVHEERAGASSPRLSVVLPVYNECDALSSVVQSLEQALIGIDHEVVVVDDNSPDGTGDIAEALARHTRGLRVIHRAAKQGVASAIHEGARATRGEVVATMNADMGEATPLLPEMLVLAETHDIVVGSRYAAGGHYDRGWWRGLVSGGARRLARTLLPRARIVQDPTSGFFLFGRAAMEGVSIPRGGIFGRVSIGVKFLLALLVQGTYSSVCEVPFHDDMRTQGRSKFAMRDCLAYLLYVLHLMATSGERERFLRFALVGLSGFALYGALLYALTSELGVYYVFGATLSWTVVVLFNFLLHDNWTFADMRQAARRSASRRGIRFVAVRLVGLGLHLLVLVGLTEGFGIHYLVAAAFALAVSVAWNYCTCVSGVWA